MPLRESEKETKYFLQYFFNLSVNHPASIYDIYCYYIQVMVTSEDRPIVIQFCYRKVKTSAYLLLLKEFKTSKNFFYIYTHDLQWTLQGCILRDRKENRSSEEKSTSMHT